jgi:glucose dehydrogenase
MLLLTPAIAALWSSKIDELSVVVQALWTWPSVVESALGFFPLLLLSLPDLRRALQTPAAADLLVLVVVVTSRLLLVLVLLLVQSSTFTARPCLTCIAVVIVCRKEESVF